MHPLSLRLTWILGALSTRVGEIQRLPAGLVTHCGVCGPHVSCLPGEDLYPRLQSACGLTYALVSSSLKWVHPQHTSWGCSQVRTLWSLGTCPPTVTPVHQAVLEAQGRTLREQAAAFPGAEW